MPKENTKPAIRFYLQDVYLMLKQKRKLRLFIEELFSKESQALTTLSFVFCTDEYLLKINQEFLQHDDLTDIITFDLSEGELTIGEIYISFDRVRENAAQRSISLNNELHRVIFHGALHLCGYRDKSDSDKAIMTSKEDQYLRTYFL